MPTIQLSTNTATQVIFGCNTKFSCFALCPNLQLNISSNFNVFKENFNKQKIGPYNTLHIQIQEEAYNKSLYITFDLLRLYFTKYKLKEKKGSEYNKALVYLILTHSSRKKS